MSLFSKKKPPMTEEVRQQLTASLIHCCESFESVCPVSGSVDVLEVELLLSDIQFINKYMQQLELKTFEFNRYTFTLNECKTVSIKKD